MNTQSDSPSTNTNLDVIVRVEFNKLSLEDALRRIARAAQLELSYSASVVAGQNEVTVHLGNVTARAALNAVLQGTGLELVVRSNGQLVIMQTTASATRQAGPGTLVGKVTDAITEKGLGRVVIGVQGTKLTTMSDATGAYTISGIPAGKYRITARLIGYGAEDRTATFRGADTVTLNITLSGTPSRLQEVVTTGAGDRKRLEVGNSIATIDAANIVPTTPIRDISDLLNGRAPGVQVLSTSGTVGSGSRIRIRGVSSILTSSDPIVIIDGVRVDAAYSQGAPGTTVGSRSTPGVNQVNNSVPATSRINDIDPESIETIEVLKGPSASTLYGSDAANGVIIIKTKRGRAGPARWSFSGQRGTSSMKAEFMNAYYGWGSSLGSPTSLQCTLGDLAQKRCTQDSITAFNPLNVRETTPLGTGHSNRYSGQVSGGNTQMQYFLGMSYNNDVGMLVLPEYDTRLYMEKSYGRRPPEWMRRPNALSALHLNSSLTTELSRNATVGMTTNVIRQSHRDVTQNASGFVNSSYLSKGYRDSIAQGWGQRTPGNTFATRSGDRINGANGSINGSWRPTAFVSTRGTIGADYTQRKDERFLPVDSVNNTVSSRAIGDLVSLMRTVDLGTSLDLPFSRYRLRSSVGGQYNRQDQEASIVTASGLPEGSEVITGAVGYSATETNYATATAGWYLEEVFAINERAFVTAAVRGDASSAFGKNADAVLYPKWSGSWLLSQEPFFPRIAGVSNLRLRAAFGQAGVQPTVDARFRSYQSAPGIVAGTQSSTIVMATVGNLNLLPERSIELEGGMDVSLWNDRVNLDLTYYRKTTKDALVTRTLAPSFGVISRQENIGNTMNHGSEISLSVQPIVTQALNWNSGVSLSRTRNKLVSLGPSTLPPTPGLAGEARYVEGYPLGGFWDRALLGFDDVDGDGLIAQNEIRLSDSLMYVGQPIPDMDISWRNSLAFFSGRMTVSTTIAHQKGLTQFNSTLWTQCVSQKCRYTVDPTTSLTQQAIIQSSVSNVNRTFYGLYERVSITRWSELSLAFDVPPRFLRSLRGRTANIALMGRNLGMWTNYRGADPQVNTSVSGNSTTDGGGVPQTRDWSIRFNLGF